MPDAEKLAAVRAAIPSLGAGIYLNTGSAGPIPLETHAAVEELIDLGAPDRRASADYFELFLERMAEARAGFAAILGADVDSVALTHATTDGMNIAAWSVDWKPGDRAVTTTHEHAGALGPLVAVRDRFGVELAFADIGDGSDDERTVAAFDDAIEARHEARRAVARALDDGRPAADRPSGRDRPGSGSAGRDRWRPGSRRNPVYR